MRCWLRSIEPMALRGVSNGEKAAQAVVIGDADRGMHLLKVGFDPRVP